MLVTLFGIVTEVNPVQPKNADLPMLITLSGIVTAVSPVQPENAEAAIPSVSSFNTIAVFSGIAPLNL